MRLKLIACKVFFRSLSGICSRTDNIIDITWIRQGEHNTPEKLHALLQKEIDLIESGDDVHSNKMNDIGGSHDGIPGDLMQSFWDTVFVPMPLPALSRGGIGW